MGLGFGGRDLGFGVLSLRAECLGFRVEGSAFRVSHALEGFSGTITIWVHGCICERKDWRFGL